MLPHSFGRSAFLMFDPQGPTGESMIAERAAPEDRAEVETIARSAGATIDFKAELARDWSRIWLVRTQSTGAIIAFALVWLVADEVHLLDIATDPVHRRRGAAQLLVHRLIETGRARGARVVLLEVRKSNTAATTLYRSFGFEVSNVRRDYYFEPREDALEMTLTLSPPVIQPIAVPDTERNNHKD